MAFTVLAWNLEQFGVKFRNVGNLDPAVAEVLRCELVAAIAQAAQADVIVIQELRHAGVVVLETLTASVAAACEDVRHFDWLPGALTADDELGFDPVANSEGYAVIWREGALAALGAPALSAGVDSMNYDQYGDHFITLVTHGQTLVFNNDEIPITFAADSNGELGFPPSTCPNVNSEYGLRSGVRLANDVIASRTHVRRPCAVLLTPINGVEIPFVVYHAPVGQNGSHSDYYGSLIGFASAQLQTDAAIYAGDFNVVSERAQFNLWRRARALGYDLDTYIQQGSEGDIGPSPSVVHYENHAGDGFRTGQQVFGSGRDYAFVKTNGGDVSTIVINALVSLRGALGEKPDLRNAVNGAAAGLNTMVAGVRAGDVVQAYLNGQALPGGADEHTALAIIYRDLVTDHLPVAIRYQV